MLPPDAPLAALQAQAAVATGWPTLHVFAETEDEVLRARAALEDLVGPLPQADEIEPFDVDDPEDWWELRCDLPGLALAGWSRAREVLRDAGFEPVLVPGVTPGQRVAEDAGQREYEEIVAGDVVAAMPYDAVDGGVHGPELEPAPAGPDLHELEAELVDAVREVSLSLCFQSDRGPDTVQPVVDRATGRAGVQVAFPAHQIEGIPGDELLQLREDLVEALGTVVVARSEAPVMRLAPDLLWDTRWGLVFTIWFVAPPLPALPGDAPIPPGPTPSAPELQRLVADLGGLAESLEVQVVPAGPEHHDEAVHAVQELAGADILLGGRPRWLVGPDGLAFCPVWRAPVGLELAPLLHAMAALPEISAVRVVPGEPSSMGEIWPRVDPSWHLSGGRCFVGYRDGVSDRSWLAPVAERPRVARDDRLELAIGVALPAGTGLPRPALREGHRSRPIRDAAIERDGLELLFDDELRGNEALLRRLLTALGRAQVDDIGSLVPVALRSAGLVVRFWYKGPESDA